MTIELINGKFEGFTKQGLVLINFHADWLYALCNDGVNCRGDS